MTTRTQAVRDFNDRLNRVADTDLSWFAGWLCADGSIRIIDDNGRPGIKFTITDRDPLDRFAELFGNTVTGPVPPSGLGKLPRYNWHISGVFAVMLLRRVYPWLSERYAARADRGLAYGGREHWGRKLTPADAVAIRHALAVGGHGTARRLSIEYGVSDGLIAAIKNGRIWKEAA